MLLLVFAILTAKKDLKTLAERLVTEIIYLEQVYRRDYEEGGIVLDPMKATHTVKVHITVK